MNRSQCQFSSGNEEEKKEEDQEERLPSDGSDQLKILEIEQKKKKIELQLLKLEIEQQRIKRSSRGMAT